MVFDQPKVMGVINLTPDSFYGGSRSQDIPDVIKRVEQMLEHGVDIIDLGAFSSRPGARMPEVSVETERIVPVYRALKKEFPGAVFSIDSYRTAVLERLLDSGPFIINDITAWSEDPVLPEFAARHSLPYILMHMKGMPDSMNSKAEYSNVVLEVLDFLSSKLHQLKKLDVRDVIIDPGFGFAKRIHHNFELLSGLTAFRIFDRPVLAGLSRKSMVYKSLGLNPEDALNGTTALNMVALERGAHILRVHDVKEAREVITLYQAINGVLKND